MNIDTIPDHELAKRELAEFFKTLNLKTQVSPPMAGVDAENWPHIAYTVTFTNAQGRMLSEVYKLGVGHVKIPKGEVWHTLQLSTGDRIALRQLQANPSTQFQDKAIHALIAAALALKQKVSPDPAEVLASICRDGMDAHQDSFANWAANYGYSADSIKAKAIYDKCTELYHACAVLIGPRSVAKLEELSNRL